MQTDNCEPCRHQNGTTNSVALPKSILTSIDKIVKKEGYKHPKIFKKQFSTNGGSYLAELYDVKIQEDGIHERKETNLFVKHIIPAEASIMSIEEAYYKESLYYNELTKLIQGLEDSAAVPAKNRLRVVKNYESNSEDIILENLAATGFRTWHRMEPITLQFAELALDQLARFHGAGFMLQKKLPDYFNEKIKPMKHHFVINDNWRTFVKHQCKVSTEKLSEDYKTKAEEFVPRIFEKYPRYYDGSSVAYPTLCHGDWRPNNNLIKEVNGNITELTPVDFQLMYYGCPINDIMFFFFMSTDQKFRDTHLDYLTDHYYKSLRTYINCFGIEVQEVYPREVFDQQFRDRLDLGLMIALYGMPFIFTSEDDFPDMGVADFLNLQFTMDARGFVRVKEIMDDYIKRGLL